MLCLAPFLPSSLFNTILDLGPITSNSQKNITLISLLWFYIYANFSILSDCGMSCIPVKRMYSVITSLVCCTGCDNLGYYVVLVLSREQWELFNYLTVRQIQ